MKRTLLDVYEQFYWRLFGPARELALTGLRVDREGFKTERAKLERERAELRYEIMATAGRPLHAVKVFKKKPPKSKVMDPEAAFRLYGQNWVKEGISISGKLLRQYLYEELKLPKHKKDGKTTANEVALRRLGMSHKEVVGDLVKQIIEFRQVEKLSAYLNEARLDSDDRLRGVYKMVPVNGRFSSSANPLGTGTNVQNFPRPTPRLNIRRYILPEENRVFLELDESAAEARVVYALTGDKTLLEVARSKPTELDIHIRNARIILQREQISSEDRQLCKSVKHGTNYGEGAQRISDELLKQGIIKTADELEPLVKLAREEPITEWQGRVEEQVIERGYLVTNWGRRLSFRGDRLGPDVYRTAYAYEPSSTVVDILNQWGLVPLRKQIKHGTWQAVIGHQGHDSLTVSVLPEDAWDIADFLRQSLEWPRKYWDGSRHHELIIPVTFKLGRTWGEMKEFKTLPNRPDFEEFAHSLLEGNPCATPAAPKSRSNEAEPRLSN